MGIDCRRVATASILVFAGVLASTGSGVGVGAAAEDLAEKKKGCEARKADDCRDLGGHYDTSKDPTDKAAATSFYEKAVRLYQQACDRGDDDACTKLGWMYHVGRGVATDPRRAVALYQGPCARGFLAACMQLGLAHEQPLEQGRPPDVLAAIAAYERTCELEKPSPNSIACPKLANLYDQGLAARGGMPAVPRDRARAVRFHQRACDGEVSGNCARLAELYEQGLGVPKDLDRSVALFKKACDLGLPEACQRLKAGVKR
jgi:TPR repeat protein